MYNQLVNNLDVSWSRVVNRGIVMITSSVGIVVPIVVGRVTRIAGVACCKLPCYKVTFITTKIYWVYVISFFRLFYGCTVI